MALESFSEFRSIDVARCGNLDNGGLGQLGSLLFRNFHLLLFLMLSFNEELVNQKNLSNILN